MLIVWGVILPLDSLWVIPFMPALIVLVETIVLKAISGGKPADVLGNLTFGMVTVFSIQIIGTFFCAAAGVSEDSYLFFGFIIALPAIAAVLAFAIEKAAVFERVRDFAERKHELIVILSVGATAPLVFLGRIYLWDSFMFWEGYASTITNVIAYLVIGTYLIRTFFESGRRRSELEVAAEYSDYLRAANEELIRREHEYKNQLNAIIGMAEKNEEDSCAGIVAFAEEIIRDNSHRQKVGDVISDNSVVASYILRMTRKAEKLAVNFDYNIRKPFPRYELPTKELIEILANLLNNAFEAVAEFPENRRRVSLNMDTDAIEVINFVGRDFDKREMSRACSTGYSTKGKGRGYGVSNILDAANRNSIPIDAYIRGEYLCIRLEMK